MENKITIPKPCNENWNSMSPNEKGRFCDSCNKTVVDFTKMNDPEIRKYFIENSGKERVCGHFKSSQVVTEETAKYHNLKNRLSRIRIKPIKIAAMFLLGLLFTLTSCMGKAAVEGEPAMVNDEMNNNTPQPENTKKENDTVQSDAVEIKK